jgi:hypothetical protein
MARLPLSILLSLFLCSASLAGNQPIPRHLKPILAAARIFQMTYRLDGPIGLASEQEAHIGNNLEVEPVSGKTCVYTMRRRDGPIIGLIDFTKLSVEHTSKRQGGFINVVYPGLDGAVCEHGGKRKDCTDELEMTLMDEDVPYVSRAMKYVFAHVCPPADLPF